MRPEPHPDFVLAGDALRAALDLLDAAIDAGTGKRPCGVPLYGIGSGFVQPRHGGRLSLAGARALHAAHLAAVADPGSTPNLARYSQRCAAELAAALAASFNLNQEA